MINIWNLLWNIQSMKTLVNLFTWDFEFCFRLAVNWLFDQDVLGPSLFDFYGNRNIPTPLAWNM